SPIQDDHRLQRPLEPLSQPKQTSRSASIAPPLSLKREQPVFKVPSLPPLPSRYDQENEPPPTFKRNKASNGALLDRPQKMSILQDDKMLIDTPATTSPRRQALAPRSQNTPHRPAPPPPKMTVLETATATAGAASAAQSRKKRNYISVNSKLFTRMDCIGRGGSSKVYRVMAENFKVFALKRVTLEDQDEAAIQGFKGEIDLLKRLENVERVVRLFDYEINEEKQTLSVLMEMGESDLNRVLTLRLNAEDAKFDITFTRYFWREMLECVHAVHEHDIVHSDLKPANFLLLQGRLKLIDFGISNAISDNTVNVHREQHIGTPNYMSPEALIDSNAASGLPSSLGKMMKLGKPSDVWSLGCILYQMVYGKPPFAHIANQMQRIMAIPNPHHHIDFPERAIGEVPVPFGLARTLKRCLNRDQSLRPTVEEMLQPGDGFLDPDAGWVGTVPVGVEMLARLQHSMVKHIREKGMPSEGELASWPQRYYASIKAAVEEGRPQSPRGYEQTRVDDALGTFVVQSFGPSIGWQNNVAITMDPVTVVGLAANVAQLVHVAVRSIEYLNDLNNACKEQARLLQEVSNILSLLISLRSRLEKASQNDAWFNGIRSLGVAQGPLDQLHEALEHIVGRFRLTRRRTSISQAVRWTLDKTRTGEILGQIERAKSLVSLALQSDIVALAQAIKLDTASIADARQDILSLASAAKSLSAREDAGAGKSILAALALDHLHEKFRSDSSTGIAGIYLDYRQAAAQTLDRIFAGLLAQLLENNHPLSEDVVELHKRHQDQGTLPSLNELLSALKHQVNIHGIVYVVVDALDELAEVRRVALVARLKELGTALRLMVTSRHTEGIRDVLTTATRLEIRANDEDIRTYIRDRIQSEDRLARFSGDAADLEDHIITTVSSKASGMFLIARLQMDSIADRNSIKAVRKILGNLPKRLDDLYREALERISKQPEDDRRLAERTLLWVIYPYRPLGFGTIRHALAVEHGECRFDPENLSASDIILDVCAGLITLDPNSDVVRLVHYTAQDYFKSHPIVPGPHEEIVKSCVSYMSYDWFQHPQVLEPHDELQSNAILGPYMPGTPDYPYELRYLLRYASNFWGAHAAEGQRADAHKIVQKFLTRAPRLSLDQIGDFMYDYGQIDFQPNPGFATAAFFGLHRTMKSLQPAAEDIDTLGYNDFSALHLAAKNGQHECIETLIEWGAKIDLPGGKRAHSPLFQAIRGRSPSAIRVLLANGADPNARDISDGTPLMEAVKHCDIQVIDKLIRFGAQVNTRDSKGRTALYWSIMSGGIQKSQRLLDLGANPKFYHNDSNSLLHSAASSGKLECLRVLLSHGVVGASSRTAMHRAAHMNQTGFVSSLDYHAGDEGEAGSWLPGSQPPVSGGHEARDFHDWTPPHYGDENENSRTRMSETLQVLLSQSIMNAQDFRGDTILPRAVLRLRAKLVNVYLDQSVDVESRIRDGITIVLGHKLMDELENVAGRSLYDQKTVFVELKPELRTDMDETDRLYMAFVHPNDFRILRLLSDFMSEEPITYWKDGMTALDYAECLGIETLVQIMQPRTRSRTDRIPMAFKTYLDVYHPRHGLYESWPWEPRVPPDTIE
ncbi:MAG: hypothetical protein Q9218_006592, partial [Villophora microphyllina]